ncbi:DEKNAAC103081 [Brettanomyces naardenensis]|uniref:DEKNAAC103081 n=1 Tax=Brettanomyces naardenensis TaxID=13370 RepID=A0A448YMH6_BRENA|nr:DEKNAAC103081 [Brettanomyces naardenensis]
MSLFVDEGGEMPREIMAEGRATAGPPSSPSPSSGPHSSQSGVAPSVSLATSISLKYQHKIVEQLVINDGLTILGRGLGLGRIVANLLHILSASSTNANGKSCLIFLINASEFENFQLGEEFMELSWLEEAGGESTSAATTSGFSVIGAGEGTTADKRRNVYRKGGIVSVSNRILVTDFLAEVIDPSTVTGLVILHADKIRDYSNDRFVVNLYRRKNKWGFLKAISDDPESFSVGFQPLSTKLRFLKLDKAFLWPRFHVDVTSSLRSRKKDNTVTEIRVQMTSYTEKIQNALMACIEALIGELRRNNPEVASDYWSMDNALDDNFVQRIRLALEPVWHRISYTTRQIVYDLGTLKSLLLHLMERDCVEFYQELSAIVESNKPSVTKSSKTTATWLMLDESMAMIACSKARIFDKVKEEEDDGDGTTYLLEEQPKWEQLSLLLDDINSDKMSRDSSEDGPILIMCSSYHTCRQLRHYLSSSKEYRVDGSGQKVFSGRQLMVESLREYMEFNHGIGDKSLKMQRRLEELEKAAKETQAVPGEDTDDSNTEARHVSKTFLRGRRSASKRRRTRGGSIIAAHDRLLNKEIGNDQGASVNEAMVDEVESGIRSGEEEEDEDDDDSGSSSDIPRFLQYIDRYDQLIVEQFDAKSNDLLLEELMPSFIICYEPSLSFIRKVELYQAPRGAHRARCYFMYYGGSIEEQKYLNDIKREKDSFTKLIREKANMPKVFSTDEDDIKKFLPDFSQTTNTRIAGGGITALPKTKVIVDMREFRSHLPFLCYLSGLEVIPCMLTIGDYILSPKICVERKSVPDLISSLKSGHLYQQCEQMFRYYEIPTLLIEFEEGKSFSLQPFNTFKNGVLMPTTSAENTFSQRDLQLKLMVLLTSYPSLKIIWSSSPFETAKLFRELKISQEEPDVSGAINAGLNPIFDKQTFFNDASIDLIQNIPGIDSVNYVLVIEKVKSLYELSQISVEELAKIIGHEAASKVVRFFKRKV